MSAASEVRAELLEQHPFREGDRNREFCVHCGKMRGLHFLDGFIANSDPPHCSMDPAVRYRVHTYFYRPGWLKNQKERNLDLEAAERRNRPATSNRAGMLEPAERTVPGSSTSGKVQPKEPVAETVQPTA